MTIESNADGFGEWFAARARDARAALEGAVRDGLEDMGERWTSEIKTSIRGPLVLQGRKSRSAALATRSGGLRDSFFARVGGEGLGGLELSLASSKGGQARLHELGTTGAGGKLPPITPKRARALTIPLPDAMTPSGVPRRPRARDWPETFIISTPERSGDVEGLIVQNLGDGELRFLYVLQRKAEIPPRLGMRETARELLQKDLRKIIRDRFERRIRGR